MISKTYCIDSFVVRVNSRDYDRFVVERVYPDGRGGFQGGHEPAWEEMGWSELAGPWGSHGEAVEAVEAVAELFR